MRRPHRSLVRAATAAGLLSLLGLGAAALARPIDEPAPPPDPAEAIEILQGRRDGLLAVEARGHGASHVRFTIRNQTGRRLKVILPPGLVAASTPAQGLGGGAGAGGGGGFQSMGLGTPTAREGSFGQFRGGLARADIGFQSVPVEAVDEPGVAVEPHARVQVDIPSVCLNFGVNTPTPRNVFHLMSVEDYSRDLRVQKALRSLATLGTSQGVAQAVMWHLCNGMTYEQMAFQAARYLNPREISAAARFVSALDASGSPGGLLDASELSRGRVLVRIQGEGLMAKDALRLGRELSGSRLFGLPVEVIDQIDGETLPATLLVDVALTGSKPGQTRGRFEIREVSAFGGWQRLGRGGLAAEAAVSDLTGSALADAIDHAVASTFVRVTPVRQTSGKTTLRIVNHLPLSLATVVLKAGKSGDGPIIRLTGLGLGPDRNTLAPPIEGPTARVERVELNGL